MRRGRRLDDRHPGEHVPRVDAPLRLGADGGEADAVVDAEQERRVGDDVGGDALAGGGEEGEDVGQVVLALGVLGPDPGQGVEEGARRRRRRSRC